MRKLRPLKFSAVAACVVTAMLIGCSRTGKDTVVVIEKTKTYHRTVCPPVHMAKTEEMSIAEAKRQNFRACPVCKPDSQ